MKKFIVVCAVCMSFTSAFAEPVKLTSPDVELCFSPKGNCDDLLIKEISSAKTSIQVAAYVLTSKPIGAALLDAAKRKVAVKVIVDSDEFLDSSFLILFKTFKQAGISVKFDSKHAIMHNKYIIIDETVLETGSYNFTFSAEMRNAENMLIFKNPGKQVIDHYSKDFDLHSSHSYTFSEYSAIKATPSKRKVKK